MICSRFSAAGRCRLEADLEQAQSSEHGRADCRRWSCGGWPIAACLGHRGIGAVILDASSSIGESWRSRYERLHLHTPRLQSGLPGYPIPRRFGRWVAKDDVATYLTEYATRHGIEPEHNVTVDRIDIKDGTLLVSTDKGPRQTANVVMATGYMRVPSMPPWPGLDSYQGEVIHAATYRSAEPIAASGSSWSARATRALRSLRTSPSEGPRMFGSHIARRPMFSLARLDPSRRQLWVSRISISQLGCAIPSIGCLSR